jgi:PPK2 family polyphosphate:nucleotide phosphotransferase
MDEILFSPVKSHLVPFDRSFRVDDAPTRVDSPLRKKDHEKALGQAVARLAELQSRLYAQDRYSVLLLFQAMDAAGKDGTIRGVLSGVNPAGCQVYSFKAPTSEELDHDFLWRVQRCLPERGRIGVFNRSHYEEVLVVRARPDLLKAQRLPWRPRELSELWSQRLESITDAEKHWARNGTVILKFWLHVSKEEQRQRLLERIDEPEGHWKFNARDFETREQWSQYMNAYEQALAATSTPWAPWYAIPADSKSYMRRTVAEIVVSTLEQLGLKYPSLSAADRAAMKEVRRKLVVSSR